MEKKQIDIKNKLDGKQTFKISRFKELIKRTKPHKHDDYYELIFLSEGTGFHSIESEKYTISAPEVYLLKPGQLHFWQFTSIPKGFVILFKYSEFDTLEENNLWRLFQRFSGVVRINLSSGDFFDYLLNEIYNESNLNTKYSKEVIRGLLRALLGKLLQTIEDEPNKSGIPQSVYERFQFLLTKEGGRLHKVNEYAGLLNVTPQNLNVICRRYSGKSASEIITSQILLEAKRFILHTDYTVNEIADALYFSDASNFVKFFKKTEGVTPMQFKAKYFNNTI